MSLHQRVLQRLLRWPPNRVFSRHDLLDIGPTDAIGMALMRLEKAGKIRRVRRGFYDRPISHPEIGILSPSADALAQAIARRDGIRLQESEAAAANMLH